MIDGLLAPGNGPFVVALLVMLGLTVVELVALLTGVGVNDLVDDYVIAQAGLEGAGESMSGLDATVPETGVVGRLLGWLYVGRVPVLMILVVFLSVFALVGLTGQTLLRGGLGHALPGLLAAPLALVVSLPMVRACVAGLARMLPRDETSAVDPATFIGRTAQIVGGVARPGLAAQARLVDQFGTEHYLLVEPDLDAETIPQGTRVLIVRPLGGGRYAAIVNPNTSLIDKDS